MHLAFYVVLTGFLAIFLEMVAHKTLPKHFFAVETFFEVGLGENCALNKTAFATNVDGFAK